MNKTAADIRAALRRHYPRQEAAISFEVAQGTGHMAHRHLDAVVMDLWPSRGLALHGIEVKVNLYDWRREKADPEKAEQIARFCDFFSIAAPAGLIPQDELPPAWGLIEVTPDGVIKTAIRPTKTEAQPITRAFMAAMLRGCQREDPEGVRAQIEAERRKLQEEHANRVREEAERIAALRQEQGANWKKLVEAIGEDPESYVYDQDVIKAVKAVYIAKPAAILPTLRMLAETSSEMVQRVTGVLKELGIEMERETAGLGRSVRRKRG
jgi:hypothetical protein